MKTFLPIRNEKCIYTGCGMSQFFLFLNLTCFILLSAPEILGGGEVRPLRLRYLCIFIVCRRTFLFPLF